MILVECYVDVALIRALGFREVRHEENKPAVIEELRKYAGGGSNMVGLVDEDPGSPWPKYFGSFSRMATSGHGFSTWVGPGGNIYIVVLRPRHEEWIYNVAKRCGIDVREYGLPGDWRSFHSRLHGGMRIRERILRPYVNLLEEMLEQECNALIELKAELSKLLRR